MAIITKNYPITKHLLLLIIEEMNAEKKENDTLYTKLNQQVVLSYLL